MTIGRLVSLMQGGIEEVFILIVPVLSVALVVFLAAGFLAAGFISAFFAAAFLSAAGLFLNLLQFLVYWLFLAAGSLTT